MLPTAAEGGGGDYLCDPMSDDLRLAGHIAVSDVAAVAVEAAVGVVDIVVVAVGAFDEWVSGHEHHSFEGGDCYYCGLIACDFGVLYYYYWP